MRNSNCKRLAVIRIKLDTKKTKRKLNGIEKSFKSTESNVGCAGRGCKMKIMTCVPIMPNKKKRTNMTRSVGMWNKVDIVCFMHREIREIGTTSSNKCSHWKRIHTSDPAANVTNAYSAFKLKKYQKRSKAKRMKDVYISK